MIVLVNILRLVSYGQAKIPVKITEKECTAFLATA